MNFEKFRQTGELSDITVVVNKTEFKLHTFPLFTKSTYFKKAVASSATSAPYVVRLDEHFPGGAETFNQLADYFYSIPITIDQKNLVALRSAADCIQCEELARLLDERLEKLLSLARVKQDLSIPLFLLEQSLGEFQQWAKQAHIVDKCFESIVQSLTRGAGLSISKADRVIINRFPVEWIVELIQLCPNENKLAVLPLAKYYITNHVFDQQHNQHSPKSLPSPTENGNAHQSAFTPVTMKEEKSTTSVEEKRQILDQVIPILGDTLEQMPLAWLNTAYEKAVEFKCQCQSILSSYITHAILHSSDLDDNMENITDDVMAQLLERVDKHKEEHVKDPQLLAKLSTVVDSYIEQLRQRGALTSEQFVKLASCIPKEQRHSHDSLLLALDDILKNEKSTSLNSDEREELLNQIDFSRINEETIAACRNNERIPQQLITEAALSLCAKLRTELEESRARLRLAENELFKSRPTYTSSNYRTRHYESPTRSRTTYLNSYDLPLSKSTYNYSAYDNDSDIDYVLSSKYLSPSLTSRYGSYSSYRY